MIKQIIHTIPTPMKRKKWCESTVLSILTNEKYKGDALLQKTFTVDFLTKKTKVNEGEVPQYYVEGNHEAIIPPKEFEEVQAELERRKTIGRGYSGGNIFSSRIICGDCGCFYGQKVWHSNDPYRKVIWRCNRKYGKGPKCGTPTLTEDQIKAFFLKAYSILMEDRETIVSDCRVMADILGDTTSLDVKISATQSEINEVVTLNNAFIRSHAAAGGDRDEFAKKAAEYDERFKKTDARLSKLQAERKEHLARSRSITAFAEGLLKQPLVLEQWDDQLWNLLVSKVVVFTDGTIAFTFKGEKTIVIKK